MRSLLLVVALGTAASACVGVPSPKTGAARPATHTADQVQAPTVTQAEFLELAHRAMANGGERGVDRVVALFPDLAITAPSDGPVGTAIAAAYARRFAAGRTATRGELAAGPARTTDGPTLAGTIADRGALGERHAALVLATRADLSPEAWAEAVRLAGDVADPAAWESLLSARPIAADWPAGAAFADAAALWLHIANCRLARGEVTYAGLAALRGEPLAGDATRAELRLLRARALALAGRDGEALLLLDTLAANAAPRVHAEALALTGLVLARRDDLPAAVLAFDRALTLPEPWPGRARVQADLAVTVLRTGDTERGLSLLLEAQRGCEAAHDLDGYVRTLRNEALYRRARGNVDAADALEARAQDLVQANGLLTDTWSAR